jgi:hypothetical protein
MRNRFKFPEARDTRVYSLADTEASWMPPYAPADEVSCVWCGEKMPGTSWFSHQIERHYDECTTSWVRGLAALRSNSRWQHWRKIAKHNFNGRNYARTP